MTDNRHSIDSGLREKVIEHLFVGDVLRCLWRQGVRDMEVLRAEVDRAGYDLVMEADGVMRHIQLKASFHGAKTARVGLHTDLSRKPSGCAIWIWFDPLSMQLGPYLWFGGEPGQPLPSLGDRVGRHTKGDSTGRKAERQNIRIISRGQFASLTTMDEVVRALFGHTVGKPE